MKIPSSDGEAEAFLASVLPSDPMVKVRPMFGNKAAFVNGNMFVGLYGSDLFVRLPEESREELLKRKGASVFEPMKGRTMKEYVVIPSSWKKRPETAKSWVARSFAWAKDLPPKAKKAR
jgi:TfoX/Sxy family transcriptional regulator of competence genes